jgi:hypothetical protein
MQNDKLNLFTTKIKANNIIPLCEKNKIKCSSLCCIYCGKTYKKRLNLEKHILLCEITRKPSHVINNSEDEDTDGDAFIENISSKNLCKMVIQLAMKCNKLENKVSELSKYVTKKIQKIDILDYLNQITKSTDKHIPLFENITEFITVEESDVEFLFYNSFMETVNTILARSIYNPSEKSEFQIPLRAFTQKQNTLYIYTNNIGNNNNNNYSWTIITKEKLVRFLNIIQFKISKAFSEWRKKNAQQLNEDNKSILYDKTFSKLMEPEFKIEKTYNKFYNNIYNNLKHPIPTDICIT